MKRQEREPRVLSRRRFFWRIVDSKRIAAGASVQAFTDCHLLALEPQAVLDLRYRFPEFDKLLAERLAIYEAKTEARIPLDFTDRAAAGRNAALTTKSKLDGEQAR